MVTDPCCYRATDPDLASGRSTGQDYDPMWNHYKVMAFPYCAHTLFLFLFHFYNIYSLLLVMPVDAECLGSSQECYALIMVCGASSHFRHGFLTYASTVVISGKLPLCAHGTCLS